MRFSQALTARSATHTTVFAAVVAAAIAVLWLASPGIAFIAAGAVVGYEWSKSATLFGVRGTSVYWTAAAVLGVVAFIGAPITAILGVAVGTLASVMFVAAAASAASHLVLNRS